MTTRTFIHTKSISIDEKTPQKYLTLPTCYIQKHQMIQTVENKQNTKHARLLEFR